MYRVRDFYDGIDTFHLFLMWAIGSFLLILFFTLAILNSNLIATHTLPEQYENDAVTEIDWNELIDNFTFAVASE